MRRGEGVAAAEVYSAYIKKTKPGSDYGEFYLGDIHTCGIPGLWHESNESEVPGNR